MSDSAPERIPDRSHPPGGPPEHPKNIAGRWADGSADDSGVLIPDPVPVRQLATLLAQKPFMIIGELMKLGRFTTQNTMLEFEMASKIAKAHGIEVRRAA